MQNTPKKPGRPQKGLYRIGIKTGLLYQSPTYKGKYAIYALSPSDAPDNILYIGATSTKLFKRYNSHLVSAKNNCNPKEQWLHQLLIDGKKPVITILQDGITYFEQACDKEREFIHHYTSQGINLLNRTPGRPRKQNDQ